ncbi:hypothetical protein BDA99DRAFT_525634 [Phascolomyces articulosus]|uniref:M-phase phosphoprotein 6 n=1 Tax=Phascolomyces articulosus TaxID=60185 RepID=A0AAD5P8R0_9FUNG|nr:hypothetical protein BDA99DRAFT_525634 [Phascolomyces articulosus]
MTDNDKKATGKQPSNRLLSMKFMQRSIEKEQQEQLEKERKRIITESEWVLEYEDSEIQKPKIHVEYQPSFLAFNEQVSTGRQSFNEFNKETEAVEKETARRKKKAHQNNLDKASELEENETLNEMRKRIQGNKKKGKKRDRASDITEKEDNKRPKEQSPKPTEQGFRREKSFIKPE